MSLPGAAFFDLDRTLMRENSGQLYALYEFKHGRLSVRQLVQSSYWLLLHRLALLDVEQAYQRALEHWRGALASEVQVATSAWFDSDVAHRLTPQGAEALAFHRAAGRPTVLLTNTSGFIAKAACASWQIDDFLANVIPSDGAGRISGELELPLCIGAGKVKKAEAWAARHGVSLAESYFYGDSRTDLPMLLRVGHPHAVNPDSTLRREAQARSWPISIWSR